MWEKVTVAVLNFSLRAEETAGSNNWSPPPTVITAAK
jgi:hypothetical protein